MVSQDAFLKEKLKSVFGYAAFRAGQEQIIKSILSGHDTFVIMPTGGGKSLCYQLPALAKSGVVLIISPLIALMKNQVDQLKLCGIPAHFLNSSLKKKEETLIKEQLKEGAVKLLYIAPESLVKATNVDLFRGLNISFVAIDEAHCISEWGHDFRPEYRRIREVLSRITKTPILALTATATPQVQLDIQHNLQIKDAYIFKSSFNRANLYYEVIRKCNPHHQLINYIKKHEHQSGIVYCLTRRKVEEIADFLCANAIKAAPYHAGMKAAMREQNQDRFMNEDIDVIVATVAFGMGINKPDVRFVLHYNLPKSLESYYQETGRAGRDGKAAHCTLLFSYGDIAKLEKFNKNKTASEKEKARHLLDEVVSYAESAICRRKQLLHYFGDRYEGDSCDFCDNCSADIKTKSIECSKELELILQTLQNYSACPSVSNLLRTLSTKRLGSHHTRYWGSKSIKTRSEIGAVWQTILCHGIHHDFIARQYDYEHCEMIESLYLTEKGKNFLTNPHTVFVRENHCYEHDASKQDQEREVDSSNGSSEVMPNMRRGYNKALYDQLNALRHKIAKSNSVPPYVIFQKETLEEIALTYPTSATALQNIQGIGAHKATKFGTLFIRCVQDFVRQHDILPSPEVLVKSSGERCRLKIQIIRQIDRKIDLRDIARSIDLSFEDLLSTMERICYSGTKFCISYHIQSTMDEEKQSALRAYFMRSETGNLTEAYSDLGLEAYSAEEIRLVRIQCLSELGN